MVNYKFVAKSKDGQVIKESLRAKSRYVAIGLLKERGLTVISLSSQVDSGSKPKRLPKKARTKTIFSLLPKNKVSMRELSVFCRQLAVSVNSGITVLSALEAIAIDMDNPYFKKVLLKVISDAKDGAHFSTALAKHQKIFNPVFVALIQSAEESGNMAKILNNLSTYFEKNVRLLGKIRSITTYPLFVMSFFVVIIFIMTIFILPKFEDTFSGLGADLPMVTQVVFGLNRFLINNIWVFILAFIGAIIGFLLYQRIPRGRYNIDQIKLDLPLFGELIKKYSIARFCRILSMMLSGGVSIGTALSISSKTLGNKVLSESIIKIREQVMEGSDIARTLENDPNFPCLVARMVNVGESSGQLPEVLDKISEMYEDQVDVSVMSLTSLFEPVVIIIFGGVILVFILAVYMPIFKLAMATRG